jgi:xylulokinase
MEYVIGCDIGSQGVKTVLLTAEGRLAGEAGAGYGIDTPQPAWAEQAAGTWIQAMAEAVQRLIREADVHPDQVRAVGLDAQVDGLVPVDEQGEPLRPAIIWMDRRAVAQTAAIGETSDPQRLFELSGLNLDPSHVAPKIRWFAENQPDLYGKTAAFLLPGSYAALYLTGELGIDYSNASSTLLMDVRRKEWSRELCDLFQVPMDRLPPIYPANQGLGTLRPGAAEALGLKPDTLLVLGCGDEHAACLGAGVLTPGLVCDITGTAEPVAAASPQPIFDETGLVETHCHADPDLWLLENPGFVSGGNFRWFRDQFAPEEVRLAAEGGLDPYDLLSGMAAKVPAGSEGLLMLPCLMGSVTPTWNALARGVFYGFTMAHRREHFIRAIMEASAYALRDITDRMQAIGLGLEEIRAVGGGARSSLWRQIKADVTGLPVTLTETVETTALGAAMLALNGAGMIPSLSQAADACVRVVETRAPDPQLMARYEEFYALYRSTYFALEPVFEEGGRISA